MLKSDEAIAYLIGHVGESATQHAAAAIEALALYRHDQRLRAQVEAAVERRADRALAATFRAAFEGKQATDEG